MSIALKLLISIIIFFFLTGFLYKGAVGRIERRNQGTGSPDFNLGPVSEKEDIAFMDGKHKQLALKQAILGALIWSIIIFTLLYFIF